MSFRRGCSPQIKRWIWGEHQRFPQLGPRQGASLWGLRHQAKSGCGQCGRHPRHGRVCGGKHPAMVETGRAKSYAAAGRLLICADAGGSNGNRLRAWKLNLQQMAEQIQIPITVCHYPPGTSKWNKIEHRLFSFISLNWRGEPLINYETIINLIGGTKTRTGLKVRTVLDTNEYETGIKVSDEQLEEVQLRRHKVQPAWNYTISPRQRAQA